MLSHVLSNITDTSYLIGDGTVVVLQSSQILCIWIRQYGTPFAYTILSTPSSPILTSRPSRLFHELGRCLYNAFNDYAKQITKGLFIYGRQRVRRLPHPSTIYYYGFDKETNWFVANNLLRSTTGSTFNVHFRGKTWGNSISQLLVVHNIMNATAVIGLLYIAGFDLDLVREHLRTFAGVKRRFTEKVVNGTVIIDDFAHQRKLLQPWMLPVKNTQSKEIVAIFQPHTFTDHCLVGWILRSLWIKQMLFT